VASTNNHPRQVVYSSKAWVDQFAEVADCHHLLLLQAELQSNPIDSYWQCQTSSCNQNVGKVQLLVSHLVMNKMLLMAHCWFNFRCMLYHFLSMTLKHGINNTLNAIHSKVLHESLNTQLI
jgi:hypothetical protein